MKFQLFNIIIPAFLLALIFGQAVYVALYLRMRRRPPKPLADYFPKAAVLLCLRGRDPTLLSCLRAVSRLQYPDFELFCVFDSSDDPAFAVVQNFKAPVPVHIKVIPAFSKKCGMKCESLITVIKDMDPTIKVVALVDADSIVSENWLLEIVKPLQDPKVGAVTGDRWFEPNNDLASTTRAVWNAAAIVQMNLYRIAWGGSLALRRSTIDELNILDVWSRTFCEDTVLVDIFRKHGLVVERPRKVIVYNHESIAWKNLHFWIARQLLTVRLHNNKWPLVFGHGLLVGLTLALCCVLILVDLAFGLFGTAMGVAATLFFAELLNFLLIVLISNENTRILIEQGKLLPPSSIRKHFWKWLISIPTTQVMHFGSTIRAMTMTHVIWRGIEYRVTPKEVSLINYRPFLDRNVVVDEHDSVS